MKSLKPEVTTNTNQKEHSRLYHNGKWHGAFGSARSKKAIGSKWLKKG